MKLFQIFLTLQLLLCSAVANAGGALSFPPEIFTVEKISKEIRSKLYLKMHEMQHTYKSTEVAIGELQFTDKDRELKATARLDRSQNKISGELTEQVESVTIKNKNEEILIKETIITIGRNLNYSKPTDRVFFSGNLNYGLDDNEESKTVIITSDATDIFRVNTKRLKANDGSSVIYTVIDYSNKKGLTLVDTTNPDGTVRKIDYVMGANELKMETFNSGYTMSGWKISPYSVVAYKPHDHLFENHLYYKNGIEVLGLNKFLSTFNDDIYSTYFSKAMGHSIGSIIEYYFPNTSERVNLTIKDRFLDELSHILSILERAKTNPVLIDQVSTMIRSYIQDIGAARLSVTDNRPDRK